MDIKGAFKALFSSKSLSSENVEPDGDSGVRTLIADSVADSITPDKLAKILRDAIEGDPAEFFELAQEMEERDQHYGSVLATRKLKIAGISPELHAASEDALDQEISDAVRRDILDNPEFVFMIFDLLDALGKGLSLIQIKWDTDNDDGTWKPESYTWIDPRWLQLDKKTKREIRIKEKDNEDGRKLDEFRFIQHTPRIKSGIPIRGGLARLSVWAWLLKSYTIKDWAAFCEIFGQPLRLGKYGRNANDKDKRALLRAVRSIARDAAAIIPDSMSMELIQTKSNGNPVFEGFAKYLDAGISKAVLGQTMTTEDGASQAQAKVHDDVRLDIASADALGVTNTINRYLIVPYVKLNYGVQKAYPKAKFDIVEAEDLDLLSKVLDRLVKLGLKVSSKEVLDRFGFNEPTDANDVLGGASPEEDAKSKKSLNKLLAKVASLNKQEGSHDHGHHHDTEDELDEISELGLSGWREQGDPLLDPIVTALNKASSLKEFADNLSKLAPDIDMGPLTDALAGSTLAAKALGQQNDETAQDG